MLIKSFIVKTTNTIYRYYYAYIHVAIIKRQKPTSILKKIIKNSYLPILYEIVIDYLHSPFIL